MPDPQDLQSSTTAVIVPSTPAPKLPGVLAHIRTVPLTSLDLSKPSGKARAYNASMSSDFKLGDLLGTVIEVSDYVFYSSLVDIEGQTGQQEIIRCSLIGPDGTIYSCASEGVVDAVCRIYQLVGPAPWNPALKVIPFEGKSAKGFRYMSLKLDVTE